MLVEAFIPKPTIEARDEGVLCRFARLDQLQLYAVIVSPLIQSLACELRPLVGANRNVSTFFRQ